MNDEPVQPGKFIRKFFRAPRDSHWVNRSRLPARFPSQLPRSGHVRQRDFPEVRYVPPQWELSKESPLHCRFFAPPSPCYTQAPRWPFWGSGPFRGFEFLQQDDVWVGLFDPSPSMGNSDFNRVDDSRSAIS